MAASNISDLGKNLYYPPGKRVKTCNSDNTIYKYPRGTKQGENWVNLTRKTKECSHGVKIRHIESIIKRQKETEKNTKDFPCFLKLIYRIRSYCIVMAYFPEGSRYHSIFEGYETHPGWREDMTQEEATILFSFKSAADTIKKNYRDTFLFDIIDEKFGNYRHSRWLKRISTKTIN